MGGGSKKSSSGDKELVQAQQTLLERQIADFRAQQQFLTQEQFSLQQEQEQAAAGLIDMFEQQKAQQSEGFEAQMNQSRQLLEQLGVQNSQIEAFSQQQNQQRQQFVQQNLESRALAAGQIFGTIRDAEGNLNEQLGIFNADTASIAAQAQQEDPARKERERQLFQEQIGSRMTLNRNTRNTAQGLAKRESQSRQRQQGLLSNRRSKGTAQTKNNRRILGGQ